MGSDKESDESDEESDEEERDGDVDQGFREQLMAVLQAGKALVSRLEGVLGLSCDVCSRSRAAHQAFAFRAVRTARRRKRMSWGMRP